MIRVPDMRYTRFGRTGLEVSVAGLGAGGFSRLGQGTGKSEAQSIAVVHAALEAGVNLIDTAAAYGTESLVGKAIRGWPRDQIILSTKAHAVRGGKLRPASDVLSDLEQSLRSLDVDGVDVFHLHAVPPWAYDPALEELVPALEQARRQGKIRFLGITETAPRDPGHEMLPRAVRDGHFDVVMVAFHMLHQSARERVFPLTREHDIATLIMFAVRLIFSEPDRLRREVEALIEGGELAQSISAQGPLDFLMHPGGAANVIDAAYRFCRHEPGADVVLFGTGSLAHLETNLRSLLAPPIPSTDLERLYGTFGHLEGIGLDAPGAR